MEEGNRRMLERERYQIEQILELDLEELQVEEVDEFHDSSDDDNNNNHHRDLTYFPLFHFVPLFSFYLTITVFHFHDLSMKIVPLDQFEFSIFVVWYW